jgi:DNA (cytosine-5)-methyltransferase 1
MGASIAPQSDHSPFHSHSTRAFRSTKEWVDWLNESLPRPSPKKGAPVAMDLFAGCGGLALGFEAAGIETAGYEMKSEAVHTYNANLSGQCAETMLVIGEPKGEADIVIGGPPCQPFSQIGYQRGMRDTRDGFPIFLDAVNRIRPKIAIIENVRGLLFRNKDYLRNAVQELERFGYVVDVRLLRAWEYGAPQKRERVVVVASKIGWEWPEPVVDEPVTAGVALGRMAFKTTVESRFLNKSMDRYVARYEKASSCIRPRDLHLDKPSRTITCRNLGGATADMIRIALPDGRRRMLHVREAARLQGFPDWFEFSGTAYEQTEQIGNAVPPLMSLALAKQVSRFLENPAMSPRRNIPSLNGSPKAKKVEQAKTILREAGVVLRDITARAQERAALCLLAVAQIGTTDQWVDAKSHLGDKKIRALRSREILAFRNEHYQEGLSSGSYDDVRRKDLALLVNAGLVAPSAKDAAADTNDGTRGYALTPEAVQLLRSFRTPKWELVLKEFRESQGGIRDRLAKAREMQKVPVTLPNGAPLKLSPGPHNELQKAIVEEFLPRFARGAHVMYIGDTEKKALVVDAAGLSSIGMPVPERGDRLPDIVAYEAERNWVFLIEAVHSSNPVDEERHDLLMRLTKASTAGRVFVTAFLTKADFRKWVTRIAWETEVWIADNPTHMIHFDGERFLGPYGVTTSNNQRK